ncbi:reverse transcriptase domain-containing protein [Bacillus toyonensis]|uniref:reverse transcriptase domain-containing protein n=1 Tax=Bacillus toyonensis TaxID=155322 RepID=UPI0020D27B31|nr:reverse transcriptase domain-containing protein [Bacillus toyonensis]
MLAKGNLLFYKVIGYNYIPLQALLCMDKKRYKTKGYIHFDNRVSIDKVETKIKNEDWVARHGFYPFIHFKIKFKKYNKKSNGKKTKERDIYYASHLDSYIYKYYGEKLNEYYNNAVKQLNINEVAIAYRNNLSGQSNIHFAREVFDFIKSNDSAYIYVADFTNFFDEIEHKYLKEKLKYILKQQALPKDYYTVFKNITKYSYIEKEKIEAILGEKYSKEDIRNLHRFFNTKEFRTFKKDSILRNLSGFGIPQGAGISSICSNIYLLDFDQRVNTYVKKYKGLYRRYCDDIIIVIPIEEDIKGYNYQSHNNFIECVKNSIPRLEIQPEKTGHYYYSNSKILSINKNLRPSKLDYLGFSFDGRSVQIREKSLFNYYTRAYRKVRICNRKSREFGRKSYRKSLYQNYTHLGKMRRGHGNFLSYVSRAQKIFDENSSTVNLMNRQIKKHWKRINKRLEKVQDGEKEIYLNRILKELSIFKKKE